MFWIASLHIRTTIMTDKIVVPMMKENAGIPNIIAVMMVTVSSSPDSTTNPTTNENTILSIASIANKPKLFNSFIVNLFMIFKLLV